MWASEMTHHCGINAWSKNSQIIHATTTSLLTSPFVRDSVVVPVFSHEPDVIRAPSGEFVMFYTAGNLSTPPGGPICTVCTDGATPSPRSQPNCGPDESYATNKSGRAFPTFMRWAAKPTGPWSAPVVLFNGTAGEPRKGTYGDTNLAGVILE